jgi:hypothetical protein
MNEHDYFKNLSIDTIKDILYKTPANDIISMCTSDIYIYRTYATMKIFPLRWKRYTIKHYDLPFWTVNMWDRLLDDHSLTWKELARLYELEILSGYKLNFKDITNWHSKLVFGDIT